MRSYPGSRHRLSACVVAATCLTLASPSSAAASRCFGSVGNGRIEASVRLPTDGPNFSAYSGLAVAAGRTHVHSTVADIITSAYAALAAKQPEIRYVYGETGLRSGGRFRPHRTHQNGLSVDFFVPVRDASGQSVPLPTGPGNRFGYDIEFDDDAAHGKYVIDFAAMAEHLYRLHVESKRTGAGIALVIFDPPLLPKLFATPRGDYLRKHLPFMHRPAWVRHDEHYHVDFAVPCEPAASDG